MGQSFMEVLHATVNENCDFKGKYIYLDNDFLSVLYKNEDIFVSIIKLFSESFLFVDPLTKFEFLRGIYVPGEKDLMEEFIDGFEMATNHNDIFQNLQKNALDLSLIYSHKGRTQGVSTVDLLLAGRIMHNNQTKPLLITGNRKDFPSFIFDTKTILNIESTKTDEVRTFSVIEFNKNKFDECKKDLEKVSKK